MLRPPQPKTLHELTEALRRREDQLFHWEGRLIDSRRLHVADLVAAKDGKRFCERVIADITAEIATHPDRPFNEAR